MCVVTRENYWPLTKENSPNPLHICHSQTQEDVHLSKLHRTHPYTSTKYVLTGKSEVKTVCCYLHCTQLSVYRNDLCFMCLL